MRSTVLESARECVIEKSQTDRLWLALWCTHHMVTTIFEYFYSVNNCQEVEDSRNSSRKCIVPLDRAVEVLNSLINHIKPASKLKNSLQAVSRLHRSTFPKGMKVGSRREILHIEILSWRHHFHKITHYESTVVNAEADLMTETVFDITKAFSTVGGFP